MSGTKRVSFVLSALVLMFIAVAECNAQEKTTLRVALFPYLPHAADRHNEALRVRLETEFEAKHIDIDVKIRKLDPWEDYYDPLWVARILQGDMAVDLIEVDAVLLGVLLDMEVIAEWKNPPATADLQPVALQAARAHGKTYGVPHWMCGHFVMTRHRSVAEARSAAELVRALEAAEPGTRNLAGNFLGSWNTPSLYLDAWADTRSEPDVSAALRVSIDRDVIAQLKLVAAQGEVDGKNPCIDGTYDDDRKPNLAARHFAKRKADALLGYSERLHYVARFGGDPKKILISSAPLGAGSDPVWFVDMFVLRNDSKDDATVSAAKRRAARLFVEYMNNPRTFSWIHASEDLGKGAPRRYLIPATQSAFEAPTIKNDPIMMQIRPLLGRGTFFPRFRLPGIRRTMRDHVLRELRRR